MCRADNLVTFMFQLSGNSGSLNLLETYGPYRGCYEMKDAYPFINICDESRDKHSQLRLKKRLNCKMLTKKNVILC